MGNWRFVCREISNMVEELTKTAEILMKGSDMLRFPNGFGSIKRLSGHRRRPYVAVKSIEGKQKPLAYFKTYEEAFQYLLKLNGGRITRRNSTDITFEELYTEWADQKFDKISKSGINGYETAFKHCRKIWRMPMNEVRYKVVQSVIDDMRRSGLSYSSQKKLKTLFYQLYDYGVKLDILDKNYAQYVELDPREYKHKKRPYSQKEIATLWQHAKEPGVQEILMLIYSGVRIGEMLALKTADVHLSERWFLIRNSKTAAGRMRKVPIAEKVVLFYESRMGTAFLIGSGDKPISYSAFSSRYDKAIQPLGMKHTIHETRHTCASLLNSAGANDVCTKMILGHQQEGVTKTVYTHKTVQELIHAINLI